MNFHDLPVEPIFVKNRSGVSSRSASTAPSTPGPTARHRGLSPSVSLWGLRLPAYEQRVLNSPKLCEACSSILTIDGLEIDKLYAHHVTLQSLLTSHQLGCNLCRLSLFEGTRIKDWVGLAEGMVPEARPVDRDRDIYEDTSSSLENTSRKIQEYWEFRDDWEPLTSFTRLWVSSNDTDSMVVRVRLNPAYGGFIPVGLELYERTLWERWELLAFKLLTEGECEIITAQSMFRPV